MVDSCFKVFSGKCFRKSPIKSRNSSFQNDKSAISDNLLQDKKYCDEIVGSTTSIEGDKRVKSDNSTDVDYYGLELEPDVTLRRHNRPYLRSISTTTSYDAMSSDEEDKDILYPLPRVNTHERSLVDEAHSRQTESIKSGSKDDSNPYASKVNNEGGRIRHETNLFKRFFQRKYKREVNLTLVKLNCQHLHIHHHRVIVEKQFRFLSPTLPAQNSKFFEMSFLSESGGVLKLGAREKRRLTVPADKDILVATSTECNSKKSQESAGKRTAGKMENWILRLRGFHFDSFFAH